MIPPYRVVVAVAILVSVIAACGISSATSPGGEGSSGSSGSGGSDAGQLPGVGSGGTCPCTIGNSGISYTLGCGAKGCLTLNAATEGISCDQNGAHDDPSACASSSTPPGSDSGALPIFDGGATQPAGACTFTASGAETVPQGTCSMILYNGNGGIADGTGGGFLIVQTAGGAAASANLDIRALTFGDPNVPLAVGTYNGPTAHPSGEVQLGVFRDGGGADEWGTNFSIERDAGSFTFNFTSLQAESGQFLQYDVHGTADFTVPCSLDAGCGKTETIHLVF